MNIVPVKDNSCNNATQTGENKIPSPLGRVRVGLSGFNGT